MHTEESLMRLVNEALNTAEKAEADHCSALGRDLQQSNANAREAEAALRLAIREVLAEIERADYATRRAVERAERAEAECERLNGACASYEQQANRDAMEIERLRKLLLRSKRGHYYCEDSWYSCPKEPESGCADESQGTECNCGADEWNAEIDAAMQEGK